MSDYTVYLAGPMTNIPAFNFPLFFDAAAWLRETLHWEVLSPAEKDLALVPWDVMQKTPGFDTGDLPLYTAHSLFRMENAMEWDLPAIKDSNGIVMLPGWEKSTGARWERTVAEALGRDIWLMHPCEAGGFYVVRDGNPNRLTEYLRGFGAEAAHA